MYVYIYIYTYHRYGSPDSIIRMTKSEQDRTKCAFVTYYYCCYYYYYYDYDYYLSLFLLRRPKSIPYYVNKSLAIERSPLL